MDVQEIKEIMREASLFQGIDDDQLDSIVSNSEVRECEEGEVIAHENEQSDEAYLILKGTLKITQTSKETGSSVLLTVLHPGQLVGELALIDQFPRSASILANKGLVLLKLPFKRDKLESHQGMYKGILMNLAHIIAYKLRFSNDFVINKLSTDLSAGKFHLKEGRYFLLLFVLYAIWEFSSHYPQLGQGTHTFHYLLTWGLILGAILGTLQYIKSHELSYKFYGIRWENWRDDSYEGIFYSLPIVFPMLLAKVLLSIFAPQYGNISQLNILVGGNEISDTWQMVFPWVYLPFTPFIELFNRGIFQSSLKGFLNFQNPFWAIIITNILLTLIQVNAAPIFPLIAFIPGCFLGWLRCHQGGIIGPIVAHLFISASFFIFFFNLV